MFGMAAALALCGMAIESSNTVGYQTKDCEKGKFYILGFQFEGTDGSMDINKLLSGFAGVDYDEDGAFTKTAPQIQIPNGVGYDVYYYLNDGYYIDEEGNDQTKAGWCDEVGTIAGNEAAGALVGADLTPGVAAWVKDTSEAGTFVQAGQVSSDATVEVTTPAKFSLRANVLPVGFDLNDSEKVTYSGITGVDYDETGAFTKTAPQLQVPNGIGYDVYYYLNDGYYIDENGDEQTKPGWCDEVGTIAGNEAAGALVSGIVPAGQGFWAKGVGSEFKMIFKK